MPFTVYLGDEAKRHPTRSKRAARRARLALLLPFPLPLLIEVLIFLPLEAIRKRRR